MVGTAKAKITPQKLFWMAGYGARDRPAEGTLHDLWLKVLVLPAADGLCPGEGLCAGGEWPAEHVPPIGGGAVHPEGALPVAEAGGRAEGREDPADRDQAGAVQGHVLLPEGGLQAGSGNGLLSGAVLQA